MKNMFRALKKIFDRLAMVVSVLFVLVIVLMAALVPVALAAPVPLDIDDAIILEITGETGQAGVDAIILDIKSYLTKRGEEMAAEREYVSQKLSIDAAVAQVRQLKRAEYEAGIAADKR